ncbi:hypothetical protein DENIT_90100 [Pseudomonas veronii]|nr:hypothetical protein DENIT_90100 [Pseudomonas veronii]
MTTPVEPRDKPCNPSAKSKACGRLGMVYAKPAPSDIGASKTTST